MTVIGSLVMAGGLFLCSFAPTIDYLYAFFGVLAGSGYGIIVVSTLLVTKQYFQENQTVALFILATGQPFGIFIIPLLTRLLLDNFSYFGMYLISSGIVLHIVLLGLFFRPLAAHDISSAVGEYTRMNEGPPESTTPSKNIHGEHPFSVDRSEATIEQAERETLKPKSSKSSYKTVEGPSETIVVSTLEKSWKFEDTTLYESEDEETDNTNVSAESVKQPTVIPQASSAVESIPSAQENIREQPETHTIFEIVMGIHNPKTLCDCRILWLTLSAILYSIGIGYPYIFYPDVAKKRGYEDTTSVWALSIMGLVGIPGVICFGAVIKTIRGRSVSGGVILLAGLSTIAAALGIAFESYYTSIGLIILSALIFGFFSVVYRFVQEEVLKEIFDHHMVSQVFFFLSWVSGFGYLLGIIIGGWLRDHYGDYGNSFVLAAICLGLAGAMLAPLMAFQRTN
ncbi:monocarboxylate transporter 9-like [Dreissena polymorpha]|nr:monocarboxylate transporter 9-like [Dreissena polymorpha]